MNSAATPLPAWASLLQGGSLARLFERLHPEVAAIACVRALLDTHDCDVRDACACAVSIYRVGHALARLDVANRDDALLTLSFLQRQVGGCEIYFSATIGADFLLVHGLGTVVGSRVSVGENVTLYHNVTLGTRYDTEREKPSVGDGAILYAGAQVIGGIRIGAGAVVAANAVVLHDVPDRTIVAGVPARPIGERNSISDDKYKLARGVR